jgi:hypothetical protein
MRRAILVIIALTSLSSQPAIAVGGNELLADCETPDPAVRATFKNPLESANRNEALIRSLGRPLKGRPPLLKFRGKEALISYC